MKELFLFSFIVIFIACQNSSHSKSVVENKPIVQAQTESTTRPLGEMVCTSVSDETFDVAKELENPENPGFYYRETALRSELPLEINRADFVCISDVTDSFEDKSPTRSAALNPPPTIDSTNATEENSWKVLTQKWEFVAETISSQNKWSLAKYPICEDTPFLAEESNLFSSYFGNSISKM